MQSGEKKITLDEFLEDDSWWEHEFLDTSQIPLDFLKKPKGSESSVFAYDPYNKIVGHEKEKAASRAIVKETLKTYAFIRKRLNELKNSGMRENDPPGRCIIDVLREEVPPMPMMIRIGPYGSSKTLQQKCEEEFLFIEREKYGLTGYDYYTLGEKDSPLGFILGQAESPLGETHVNRYFAKKEDRAFMLNTLKWLGVGSASAALVGGMLDLVLKYWWEIPFTGENGAEWLTFNLASLLPYIEEMVVIAALPTALAMFKRWANRNKSNDPKLLSTGSEMVAPYVGHEKVEDLRGEFLQGLDAPAQFKLKLGDMLKANEKMLTIENLHSLSPNVQKNLSQIIEEKVVDVADLPREYRKFVYTFISAGINTDKLASIEESLQNRINYAEIQNVMNNVSRSEEIVYHTPESNTTVSVQTGADIGRNKKNERHLAVLLGDIADRMGGRPWRKDAYTEFVDYCSRLADNSKELHISRRVIKLPKKAEFFADREGSPYIERRHVILAEKELKSITQSVMERKIEEYSVEQGVHLDNGSSIGRINVLLSYHDSTLKGIDPSTPKEIYDYIQTEDYVGYVAPITAVGKEVNNKSTGTPTLEIITKDKSINKEFVKNSLKALFMKDGVDLDRYKVYVSIPSLKDDDVILSGAYVAVRSAIEKHPIRPDACLATRITDTGAVTSVPRLNSRLLYAEGIEGDVVVSAYDKENKINDQDGKSLYPGVKFRTVSSLDEMYGAFVGAQ